MKAQPNQLMLTLRDDFRHHLEQFYASLHLAPPYNSIEKAIRFLSTAFQQKSEDEQKQLTIHLPLKWALFEQAFLESGLPLKHRGIICRLVQSNQLTDLPTQYQAFTKPFLAKP